MVLIRCGLARAGLQKMSHAHIYVAATAAPQDSEQKIYSAPTYIYVTTAKSAARRDFAVFWHWKAKLRLHSARVNDQLVATCAQCRCRPAHFGSVVGLLLRPLNHFAVCTNRTNVWSGENQSTKRRQLPPRPPGRTGAPRGGAVSVVHQVTIMGYIRHVSMSLFSPFYSADLQPSRSRPHESAAACSRGTRKSAPSCAP